MMQEIWKDIPNYEGLYQVSNLGRVKSLNGYNHNIELILSQKSVRYNRVSLSKNGKTKSFSVHRLVAQAFIPNPNNYPCINHKDENIYNNTVDNLEWCSYKYNTNYGTCISRRAKKQTKKINQYDLNGNFIKQWEGRKEIYNVLKIPITTISGCCLGYLKTAHNYIWKYEDKN